MIEVRKGRECKQGVNAGFNEENKRNTIATATAIINNKWL